MCGIAVLLGRPGQVTLPMIRSMTELARHRGPDDEGYALFAASHPAPLLRGGPDTPASCYQADLPYAPRQPHGDEPGGAFLALGHRRLSILDLSPAGHQPMSYADGRFWIAYNGEVYNYRELRGQLEALGHRFRSGTDTEVILAAYAEWGQACLERFNGMFAFAIHDREKRTLFVARDRFGIKPLYYWVSPDGIVAFASEIKQFTALPGWRARAHPQRSYDFLNWRVSDHTCDTLFAGVYQLRGGEYALVEAPSATGEARPGEPLLVRRWYELRPQPFDGDFAAAAAGFRDLLTDSVRLRLRADVPVGSCLSGGLDSSTLVCLMDALLKEQGAPGPMTFSSCATHARYDEREFIEDVVRSSSARPHYVYPELETLFGSLDEMIWHQDEPFGSTSIYAQWHVFRLAASSGVRVMLDGQGADEQLAGYHIYFGPLFAGLLRQGQWGALWREVQSAKRVHGYSEAHAMRTLLGSMLPVGMRSLGRRLAARTQLAPDWLDLDRLGARPEDPFYEAGAVTADMRSLSIAQLTRTNVQMLLHWEDRDSMAHSIESRVPFLDYRLVEFVLGLPDQFKLSEGMTKRVLREATRGVLPERIRTRTDKMGFVTPEEIWVRKDAPDVFRRAVAEAVELSRGILTPRASEHFERILAGKEPWEFFAWRMIAFGAWMRRFEVAL